MTGYIPFVQGLFITGACSTRKQSCPLSLGTAIFSLLLLQDCQQKAISV